MDIEPAHRGRALILPAGARPLPEETAGHDARERIPERVVHARGTTTFGYLEARTAAAKSPG
ncbi:MAG: catalase [Actinoallomurus sp.]